MEKSNRHFQLSWLKFMRFRFNELFLFLASLWFISMVYLRNWPTGFSDRRWNRCTWWIPGRWRCRWRRWCGASWTAKRMDPQGCFSADFFNGWMSWKMVLSRRFHHQKWWFPWDFYGFMASKMVISWELTSKNGDSIGFNLIFTIFTWWFDRIDVIKHGDFSIPEIGM